MKGEQAKAGAKTANPRQQGLKQNLIAINENGVIPPKRLIQDNKD